MRISALRAKGRGGQYAAMRVPLFVPPRPSLAACLACLIEVGGSLPLVGTWWPWIGDVPNMLAQFLVPATSLVVPTLLAGLLVRRMRWVVPVLALVLLMQASVLAPWLAPPAGAIAASPSQVRIVFFNIWKENGRPEDAVRWLAGQDADIVVLAETTPAIQRLAKATLTELPFTASCRADKHCEMLLLSRWPLADVHALIDYPSYARAAFGTVETGHGALRIGGTHLTNPLTTNVHRQLFQVDKLVELGGPWDGSMVMVGDMNGVAWGRVVQRFARLTGLEPVRGLTGTWNAWLPAPLRIGIWQAFASNDLTVVRRQVGPLLGSDHRPVVIDVQMPPRGVGTSPGRAPAPPRS